ncbi:SO_0444 family Cu/Zn efflux transporter [Colwelliaceae bacterium 6471]
MDVVLLMLNNFISLSAEASPWLLLGLLIAGLMKAWVPTHIMSRHLGQGKSAIIKAALIGAPLPLCSCGVIPVATELRRSGASTSATSSFLVATPETGVDSISVSYALLGPVMAIYRPITAVLSAILTGFLVSTTQDTSPKNTKVKSSCCASQAKTALSQQTNSCCSTKTVKKNDSIFSKTLSGIHYAATQLIDDLIIWLIIGLAFATLVKTFLPPTFLVSYGSGLVAMLIMMLISIPMYICATASTPIAAGFIMAGLSPGTALVFMMAGPATNISTLGVIKNEMGLSVLVRYLLGIAVCAIAFGYLLDIGLHYYQIDIIQQMEHSHELLPEWLGLTSALIIALLAIKPLRNTVMKTYVAG